MESKSARPSELLIRPFQVRRELLKSYELVTRIARDLESTSDWLLCARKAARLSVPVFAQVALLDLTVPGSSRMERVACARADQILGERFDEVRSAFWNPRALQDIEARCMKGGACELSSGAALRQVNRWTGLSAREFSVWVLPLRYRAGTLGYLTLIRSREMPAAHGHALSEVAEVIGTALGSRQAIENLRAEINQKDLFFSAATHDLRVPLTTLMMQVDLLKLKLESGMTSQPQASEGPSDPFQSIFQAMERLDESVQSLYDCSRIKSGTFQLKRGPVNLGQLVERILEDNRPLLKSSGNEVRAALAPDIAGNWDPKQLTRVINNLLHNSMKYAPRTLIEVTVSKCKGEAVIQVRDHGSGIQKPDRARIFDSFFRATKDRGTVEGLGLGLFICKGVVEAHEGTIQVHSPVDGGTEFVVKLPLDKPAKPGVSR